MIVFVTAVAFVSSFRWLDEVSWSFWKNIGKFTILLGVTLLYCGDKIPSATKSHVSRLFLPKQFKRQNYVQIGWWRKFVGRILTPPTITRLIDSQTSTYEIVISKKEPKHFQTRCVHITELIHSPNFGHFVLWIKKFVAHVRAKNDLGKMKWIESSTWSMSFHFSLWSLFTAVQYNQHRR